MKCQQETKNTIKNIPKRLKWYNTIYEFSQNKGNTLCYLSNEGDSIIVEYRPNRRYIDSFYVLFYLTAYCNLFDEAKIDSNKIFVDRMAKPY